MYSITLGNAFYYLIFCFVFVGGLAFGILFFGILFFCPSKDGDKYAIYKKCGSGMATILLWSIAICMYIHEPASPDLNRKLLLSVGQATAADIVHCTTNIEELPKTRLDVETLISCLQAANEEENVSRGKEILQNLCQ